MIDHREFIETKHQRERRHRNDDLIVLIVVVLLCVAYYFCAESPVVHGVDVEHERSVNGTMRT